MFSDVTRFLGEDVLMYASDYPHSECQFPDSVSNVLEWSAMGEGRMRKLMAGNADRFFRRG
jgi:predicted TIM-barrel fold metal-dependent hydrolase